MRIEDRGLGRVGGRPNITTGATGQMPKHLKQLEFESIEILREVAAELRAPVLLYSMGKDFECHASSGDEGVLPWGAAFSAFARRHHLEIP